MKFFIPLGFRYGDSSDPYSHIISVFGPYKDDEAVGEALCRLWPNDKKEQFLVFDGNIVTVTPSAKEKPEHEKRAPGNMENYVKDGDAYKCKDCGVAILFGEVSHPVHMREMPGTGFGECEQESVPYCPNCDHKPNFRGAPISV